MFLPYFNYLLLAIIQRYVSYHIYEYFAFMTEYTYYSSGAYLYDPNYQSPEDLDATKSP